MRRNRRERAGRGRSAWCLAAALVLVLGACAGDDEPGATTTGAPAPAGTIVVDSEFVSGSDGWAVDVADYTEATRPEDLLSETGVAPPGFDEAADFIHVAATNRSDDLFTYLMRPVADAEPNGPYVAEFLVEFASNAPSGCAGIGGAPGESVWMKAGAVPVRPAPVQENGETRLSIDKGGQSQGGADAAVIGDVANGIPCEEALAQDPAPYALVTHRHTLEDPVTADADGNLWLFVGTDSGFEGRTSLYYDRIEVRLVPADGAGASS